MAHLESAPHLLLLNKFCSNTKSCRSQYSGFINVMGIPYKMCIDVPVKEGLPAARVECEWNLQHKIQRKAKLIQQRLESADSVAKFLDDFVLIAESCVRSSDSKPEMWSEHSKQMVEQIKEIGWKRLISIDELFSTIELGYNDEAGRLHKLKIKLNKQDRLRPPVCQTDFPERFEFHWSGKTRLIHVVREFEAAVNCYQEFWNMMKDIDEKCWVLEPEHPSFATTQRRIALGPNMSLQIIVNCRQPTTLPECRLLGAESAIAELREKLNTNLHRWDIDRSLLNNLQEVLDLDFPSKSDTRKEELSIDCGICYCHNLNDEVPDVVCEDKRCAQVFHRSCLYEWLRNLSARQSFNTLFGECPFCNHPIRVKMPAG